MGGEATLTDQQRDRMKDGLTWKYTEPKQKGYLNRVLFT